MGPQRSLGIYVGFESPSIVKFLEPQTGNICTARFTDCVFDEENFPPLGGERNQFEKEITWFYTKRVTKSHILAENAPVQIEIPKGKPENKVTHEITTRLKRGRPPGILWNRKENIDDAFSYNLACDIMNENNGDPEPRSITECKNRHDWVEWKKAIETELDSLNKRKVFGPIVLTPKDVKHAGYKWVFETYSPVMDGITFRYLISLAVHEKLNMHLMDVVTAYLYGSLDTEIYMKIPEGFKMHEALSSKPRERYSIKLERSLYGLKQSGRMWYNQLSEYLFQKGYVNDPLCPCVFIKKTTSDCVIIAVYVDDLNIIGTSKEILEVISYLKKEFEMKDLGKTKYCLGLQIVHLQNGILVHQSNYTNKIIKHFNMDKSNPLSTPMVVRSLDVNKDPFRSCEESEQILDPEVPYFSAIGALMYLANCTRPDISFAVNLLARFSSAPTKRYWNGVKHIFRYLQGTIDLGLFYPNNTKPILIGYADAGYLSDPHKDKSQTRYVFTCGGTAISWRSQKQTLGATPSNHAEVIALHEASRECVWLRSMTENIKNTSGLQPTNDPITLYEDNAACVAQMKEGFVKSDRTKHISPKFFSFTQELEKNNVTNIQYVHSCENSADLLTKALPTSGEFYVAALFFPYLGFYPLGFSKKGFHFHLVFFAQLPSTSNSSEMSVRPPEVLWAQRSDKVYLTVALPDAKDVAVTCEPEGNFSFSSKSAHGESDCKTKVVSRNIICSVQKAEEGWWSRLLKSEGKPAPYIKVDWNKWRDEDDSDSSGSDMDPKDEITLTCAGSESSDDEGMLYLPDLKKASGN
ncbi:unnamed protein product [Rhodiola kirilowii]